MLKQAEAAAAWAASSPTQLLVSEARVRAITISNMTWQSATSKAVRNNAAGGTGEHGYDNGLDCVASTKGREPSLVTSLASQHKRLTALWADPVLMSSVYI